MKKFLKRLWLISFIFFLASHCITKYINHTDLRHGLLRMFASLPFGSWEGRDDAKIQICPASAAGVVKLLNNNPNNHELMPHDNTQQFHEKGPPPEYIVLRCKNDSLTIWGDMKCYFSGFPFPLVIQMALPSGMPYYYDIIYPYPAPLDGQVEENYTIKIGWKNFWGN